MRNSLFKSIALVGLSVCCGQVFAQHIVVNQYNNESEIHASGSVTLGNGFFAPAGSTLRVYTTGVTFKNCFPASFAPSAAQNYVLTRTFRIPVTDATLGSARNACEENQTIAYFDGLGRPLQTVNVQASPAGNDLVQPFAYDAFGREVKKYLPYAAAGNNGNYRTDALVSGAGLMNFYLPGGTGSSGEQIGTSGVARIPNPYAETDFEASPLNRVKQQASPGTDWALASGHTQKMQYGTNVTDEVKLWVISATSASAVNSRYAAGKLYKTTVWDENSTGTSDLAGATEEFKDFEGRVVLKKVYNRRAADNALEGLSTYYVYDDLGNLRYVLPPALHENGQDPIETFTDNDTHFNNFIYAYRYDGRRRLTEKKIPGKGWEYLVYNSLDQVILSQDAEQRKTSQYLFSKYDALGRVVETGIYTDGTPLATLRTTVSAFGVKWEHKITTGQGYSNDAFPQSGTELLSVNYYDDYTFPGNSLGLPTGTVEVGSGRTIGLQTGSLVKVLGSTTMLQSINFYDEEGRVVRSKSQHYLSGSVNASNYDEVSNTYSFVGELLSSTRVHHTTGGNTTIANRYEYDHAGRKVASMEEINGQGEVVLAKLDYNEIGQLKNKNLHSTDGTSFLQNVASTYNERGWLRKAEAGKFKEELKYTATDLAGLSGPPAANYNGNISAQGYNGDHSGAQYFKYGYDPLNRLTSSVHSNGTVLNETISYDVMGNILSLQRAGGIPIIYAYQNSNKSNVLDQVSGGLTGGYTYDDNGNMKTDGTKGGTATLTYNYLNLPVTVSGSVTANYTYDAAGSKLKSTVGGISKDYIGGIHYEGGALKFIATEVGRAVKVGTSNTFRYEYNLSDHLGNVRVSIDDQGSNVARVVQEDEYYAFGLAKPGGYLFGDKNNYLYNGKELQDGLGQYDYGARFYDPVIGRWNVVDPLAELSRRYSPYTYGNNNPIRFVDPDGMMTTDANGNMHSDNAEEAKSMFMELQNSSQQNDSGPGKKKEKKEKEEQGYTPVPKDYKKKGLPGFPGSKLLPSKGGARPSWDLGGLKKKGAGKDDPKMPKGSWGEWDSQHGEVEVYNKEGEHQGAWNPENGEEKEGKQRDDRKPTYNRFGVSEPDANETIKNFISIDGLRVRPILPSNFKPHPAVSVGAVLGTILVVAWVLAGG